VRGRSVARPIGMPDQSSMFSRDPFGRAFMTES
jgi:hypothetical protein